MADQPPLTEQEVTVIRALLRNLPATVADPEAFVAQWRDENAADPWPVAPV